MQHIDVKCQHGIQLKNVINSKYNLIKCVNQNVFVTLVVVEQYITVVNLLIYFLKIPFMTIKIIVGIHFEAIILYLKGVKFFKCPNPNKVNFVKYIRNKK